MELDPNKQLVDVLRNPDFIVLGQNAGAFKALHITSVASVNLPSVADNDGGGANATVTGIAIGDAVLAVIPPVDPGDDVIIHGTITATNTVRITLANFSGGAVDLDSGTFKVVWLDLT